MNITNKTNKILPLIFISAVSAISTATAATVNVDFPGANLNIPIGTVISTDVSTTDGASFTIDYTLGATSNLADADNPAFIISDGSNLGVGTVGGNEISATLGGNNFNGGGNGISFTNLSISNFMAGTSILATSDITNLEFDTVTISGADDPNDGAFFSFNSFNDNPNRTDLITGGTVTLALADFATQPTGLATDFFVEPDSGSSALSIAVAGLSVSFDAPADVVPEPSSTALLGLGGLALILRRKRG